MININHFLSFPKLHDLTLAPVVIVDPEELAESLEDDLAAAAVALLHVAVQRVQTLVADRVARG